MHWVKIRYADKLGKDNVKNQNAIVQDIAIETNLPTFIWSSNAMYTAMNL